MSLNNPTYLEYPEEILDIENAHYIDVDPGNKIMAKLPTIVYSERNGVPLHIELVIPEKHEDYMPLYNEKGAVNDIVYPTEKDGSRGKRFPLVIYVQGSGWGKQNLGFRIAMHSRIVDLGYAMAYIEYSGAETAAFPAAVLDIKKAIRFLKRHADEYNLDPERIVMWGDSSGAHLAVTAAVTDGIAGMDEDPDDEFDCSVKGVIDFYAPVAVDMFNKDLACFMLGVDTLEGHEEELRAADPRSYIEKGKKYPPFMIMHGTKDRLVSLLQSKLLYDRMRECGLDVEIYVVRGGDHGRAEYWCDAVYDVIRQYLEKWIPEK